MIVSPGMSQTQPVKIPCVVCLTSTTYCICDTSRVEKFISNLQHIVYRQIDSTFLNGALEILQSHGARRMDSILHGDLTFELEQPG